MERTPKEFFGALKAQAGLEAIIGLKTTAQIAQGQQVHLNLVTQIKRRLEEQMAEVCEVASN